MENRNEKIKSIFSEAYKKKCFQERTDYLDRECGKDADLRAEVESLLEAYSDVEGFLDPPILDSDVTLNDSFVSEGSGTVIGRYKLLEKIGEGGMAVVYMAEQEKPIRRKVALKIIKLGMDTKQVIARFEAERQALAMMDHPNISKVLDAGATETGRSYFVMELVTGLSITEYCDKNNLSTKERLALFIQVCNAVQHAHQKGIIHRDIKPSNVMVAHHDGKPVPKVIDFGIAKATNQRLTEKTLFTRYAHIIGTPAYMSPEQAELSHLGIDIRTDIYSLGVLLYELLTGSPPFGEEELRKAGYLEMQRMICEEEPPKPSTKLSTLGPALMDIAKYRKSTPDLLRKTIRGDLDWIVMKSLEKERIRRYETAEGLALDIQRYLGHKPVLARAPSVGYRLGKFLQRHRTQTVATLATAILIMILISVLSVLRYKQNRWKREEASQHRHALSRAEYYLHRGEFAFALAQAKLLLDSKHVEREAGLLIDRILVEVRDQILHYTDEIQADPENADNYFFRAQYYDLSGDQETARSDMEQYVAIAGRGQTFTLQFGTAERLGPPVNSPDPSAIEYRSRIHLGGLGITVFRNFEEDGERWVFTRPTTHDDWSGAVRRDTMPEELRKGGYIMPGWTTEDGLEMYASENLSGNRYGDITVIKRERLGLSFSEWESEPIGLPVNTEYSEIFPSVSPDGRELYFSDYGSPRPKGYGSADIWVARRETRDDPWQEPNNLGPLVNSPSSDNHVHISADGLLLFFMSNRPGGCGGSDLYVTRRKSLDDPWQEAVNLGPRVNSPFDEKYPNISLDSNELFFNRNDDIWRAPIIALEDDSAQSDSGKEVADGANQ